MKSKAAVIVGPRKVEIREITIPEPGPGQVLIRQKACAICTLEQRIYTNVVSFGYPGVWGHEVSGVVEAIGPGVVAPLSVGDHVARGGSSACGQCYFCAMGFDVACVREAERLRNQSKMDDNPGSLKGIFGMSEYAVVDSHNLVKVSPALPFEEACLVEPLACVTQSANKLDVELGQTVVVIGAGTMGLLNALVAKLRGAFVIVSEPDPRRRAKALELGVHAAIDPSQGDAAEQVKKLNDGRGADAVIVAIGNEKANADALKMLGPQGKMMLFASAHPSVPIPLDPNVVHRSGIWITGSTSKNFKDFFQASLLISRGILNVRPLIEKVLPLDRVGEALELASSGGTYRIVVTM